MELNKIILIDDKEDKRVLHKNKIESFCKGKGISVCVEAWDEDTIKTKFSDDRSDDDSNASEDKLYRILKSMPDLDLVIVDRDLSGMHNILTQSSVMHACLQAGIPVCTYHRKARLASQSGNLSQIISQINSYSISVELDDDDSNEFASSIVEVALGFKEILEKLPNDFNDESSKSPSKLLASLIGFKNLTIYFDRYAQSGSLASFIIDRYNHTEFSDSDSLKKRVAFMLGCWLHNHIMAFPGIILNNVATSSYVNLSEDTFKVFEADFNDCKYAGPFGKFSSYWLRNELDSLLEDYEDGLDYLKRKHQSASTIARSQCSVDPQLEAGYYCVISQKPISLEKSIGKLSWVPDGASLCRVNRDIYDQLAPLMGL